MRALDCSVCGEVVQADDDGALADAMRKHVREQHGAEGEEAVAGRVESDAYAPPTGEPPWAY
jgi:hypothetical protein